MAVVRDSRGQNGHAAVGRKGRGRKGRKQKKETKRFLARRAKSVSKLINLNMYLERFLVYLGRDLIARA